MPVLPVPLPVLVFAFKFRVATWPDALKLGKSGVTVLLREASEGRTALDLHISMARCGAASLMKKPPHILSCLPKAREPRATAEVSGVDCLALLELTFPDRSYTPSPASHPPLLRRMKLFQLASAVAAVALSASSVSAKPLDVDTLDQPAGVQRSIEAREAERLVARGSTEPPSPLSNYEQYSFPAQLAQAAYCGLPVGSTVGDATLLWTAGDGGETPMVYVAYSPSLGVVVSHQGTNTSSFASILNDAEFKQDPIDSRLSYLGDVEVHAGFQDTWLRTADSVLAQVQSALVDHPGSPVLAIGHSLGASIALFDALYLKHQLPSNSVQSIVFGQPRTGDQAFANAVDANLAGFVHINNGHDPVPRLPPAIDYKHASGEIWINPHNTNTAVTCPGQENQHCIDSVSPFDYHISDHTGTYFDVHIAGRGENCPPAIN